MTLRSVSLIDYQMTKELLFSGTKRFFSHTQLVRWLIQAFLFLPFWTEHHTESLILYILHILIFYILHIVILYILHIVILYIFYIFYIFFSGKSWQRFWQHPARPLVGLGHDDHGRLRWYDTENFPRDVHRRAVRSCWGPYYRSSGSSHCQQLLHVLLAYAGARITSLARASAFD